MTADFILFIAFSVLAVFSALSVIAAVNSVHSILFLILAFLNAAGALLLLGADFLAMLFLVVYVGAVAILFLFIVMMLNPKTSELEEGVLAFAPVGASIGCVFLYLLFDGLGSWFAFATPGAAEAVTGYTSYLGLVDATSTIQRLGAVLYTDFVVYFLIAGALLLLAMVGAILLTLSNRGVQTRRNQEIFQQVTRNPSHSLVLVRTPASSSEQH
jgi:NADH-quinone oxidoreductase subunit J